MASLKPHVYQGVADVGSVTIPDCRAFAGQARSHEREPRSLRPSALAWRHSLSHADKPPAARLVPGNAEAGRDKDAGESGLYSEAPGPYPSPTPRGGYRSERWLASYQFAMGDSGEGAGMVLPFCVGDANLFADFRGCGPVLDGRFRDFG